MQNDSVTTEAVPSRPPYHGTIVAIRGSVIDIAFPDTLPDLHNLLRVERQPQIAVEVITYLNAEVVRGIALTPTQGIARGDRILDTGQPLQVPIGPHLLGRVFNVFGEAIDGQGDVEGEPRSIHARPVPLKERSTSTELLETGIKAIDLLAPLERGSKAGLFGGAGVWVKRSSLPK